MIKILSLLTLSLLLSCSQGPIMILNPGPIQPAPKEKKSLLPKPKVPLSEKEPLSSLSYIPPKGKRAGKKIGAYCQLIEKYFKKYRFEKSYCERYRWHHVRNSVLGRPLIWKVYGEENPRTIDKKDVTLVLCGVHGDEITPMRFCFDIIKHMEVNKELYRDKLIVVAPLVNPDSFLKRRPTRTNHNGVDVNRNFPTKDWNKDALRLWKKRYRRDKRRFPGNKPLSEPEAIFQANLIKRYHPDKIISVHAPLTMLDYDGPLDPHSHHAANQLLISMSEKAAGYRVKNFPYYPGSLGNYAGIERHIPTYTLELPTSDSRYSRHYWQLFKEAMHHAFSSDLKIMSKKIASQQQENEKKLP